MLAALTPVIVVIGVLVIIVMALCSEDLEHYIAGTLTVLGALVIGSTAVQLAVWVISSALPLVR